MPNADTFSIRPIREFIQRYCNTTSVSVDPFAKNCSWATYTNDINPNTTAQSHQDAEVFLQQLADQGVTVNLAFFDPPYSPRQISEHYRAAGLKVTAEDTQNALLYKRVRTMLDRIVQPGGIVLSFGWQSMGMGLKRGYRPIEILLVPHGAGHNDTICMAELKACGVDHGQERQGSQGDGRVQTW
jgi:hypothetical protein